MVFRLRKGGTPKSPSSPASLQKDQGSSCDVDAPALSTEVVCFLRLAIKHLDENALQEEGLYRISGRSDVVASLTKAIKDGRLTTEMLASCGDVHAVAGAVKRTLRDHAPVIPYDMYLSFCAPDADFAALRHQLPPASERLLECLLQHLRRVLAHSDVNRMTAPALARVVGLNMARRGEETDLGDLEATLSLFLGLLKSGGAAGDMTGAGETREQVASRSVKVAWRKEEAPPTAAKLRNDFALFGNVEHVAMRGRSAAVLLPSPAVAAVAVASYRGPFRVKLMAPASLTDDAPSTAGSAAKRATAAATTVATAADESTRSPGGRNEPLEHHNAGAGAESGSGIGPSDDCMAGGPATSAPPEGYGAAATTGGMPSTSAGFGGVSCDQAVETDGLDSTVTGKKKRALGASLLLRLKRKSSGGGSGGMDRDRDGCSPPVGESSPISSLGSPTTAGGTARSAFFAKAVSMKLRRGRSTSSDGTRGAADLSVEGRRGRAAAVAAATMPAAESPEPLGSSGASIPSGIFGVKKSDKPARAGRWGVMGGGRGHSGERSGGADTGDGDSDRMTAAAATGREVSRGRRAASHHGTSTLRSTDSEQRRGSDASGGGDGTAGDGGMNPARAAAVGVGAAERDAVVAALTTRERRRSHEHRAAHAATIFERESGKQPGDGKAPAATEASAARTAVRSAPAVRSVGRRASSSSSLGKMQPPELPRRNSLGDRSASSSAIVGSGASSGLPLRAAAAVAVTAAATSERRQPPPLPARPFSVAGGSAQAAPGAADNAQQQSLPPPSPPNSRVISMEPPAVMASPTACVPIPLGSGEAASAVLAEVRIELEFERRRADRLEAGLKETQQRSVEAAAASAADAAATVLARRYAEDALASVTAEAAAARQQLAAAERELSDTRGRLDAVVAAAAAAETENVVKDDTARLLEAQDALIGALQAEIDTSVRLKHAVEDDFAELEERHRQYVTEFLLWRGRCRRCETRLWELGEDPDVVTTGCRPAPAANGKAARKGAAAAATSAGAANAAAIAAPAAAEERLPFGRLSAPERHARAFERQFQVDPTSTAYGACRGGDDSDGGFGGMTAMAASAAARLAGSMIIDPANRGQSRALSRQVLSRAAAAQRKTSLRLERELEATRAELHRLCFLHEDAGGFIAVPAPAPLATVGGSGSGGGGFSLGGFGPSGSGNSRTSANGSEPPAPGAAVPVPGEMVLTSPPTRQRQKNSSSHGCYSYAGDGVWKKTAAVVVAPSTPGDGYVAESPLLRSWMAEKRMAAAAAMGSRT